MSVSDQVRRLEAILAKLREANAFLLDQDMWDRWGRQHASDQEIDERATRERLLIDQRVAALRDLTALVGASSPETISQWAEAHDRLLAKFIESSADSTALHVAREEREGWQAVKRGEQPFVEGNTFYVQLDRELYAELFG